MPVSDYLVTIGLEVHCQIKTATKMFCSCKAGFGYEPNTNVCPTQSWNMWAIGYSQTSVKDFMKLTAPFALVTAFILEMVAYFMFCL